MSDMVYLYEPRGGEPVAFRKFEDALGELCKDRGVRNLAELAGTLPRGWWYEFTGESVSIDDGEHIYMIELR